MKKTICVTGIFLILLGLVGCDYHKINNYISLPDYYGSECYWGEGFQDYTDYCKYFYDEDNIKKFETHPKFKKVEEIDIESIRGYFIDFDEWMKFKNYYERYDFNCQSQIKKGDYFYVIDKGETIDEDDIFGKYTNYSVYYVDMSMRTLYYIHSNI